MTTDTTSLAADRTRRALELMTQTQVDHLLLGNADNIRFATDYRTLIIHETADHMLCLQEASGAAEIFGPQVRQVEQAPDPRLPLVRAIHPVVGWVPLLAGLDQAGEVVGAALARAGARKVGYDVLHPVLLEQLRTFAPNVDFVYVGGEFFELRREKLPAEVRLMELAGRQNLRALESALEQAKPGMTDREVLAVAVAEQQRSDAELITHFTCNVRSGYDWFPAGRQLVEGDAFFVDQVYYGRGGYASDLTRTAFVGEPARQLGDAYSRLVNISRELQSVARTGASVTALDEFFLQALKKNSLGDPPYGLGHGIGLRVMEPPSVLAGVGDATLRGGEVIALEPETWVEHNGQRVALKVEDCFLVEDDGLRPLVSPAGERPLVIGV